MYTMRKARLAAIGMKLRDVRNAAGYTLQSLESSTQGHFKASAVGAYERGEREIPITKLLELCDVYECAITDIINHHSARGLVKDRLASQDASGRTKENNRDMQG